MVYIGQIAIILVATLVASFISNRIGIPAVLGELIVGILIGPALLSWISPTNFIKQMAEIGVILLMFAAGCESDLDLLRKYFKPSMLAAFCGMVLPIILIAPLGIYFGMVPLHAIFLGVVFAATSVSISVVVMKELNFTQNREASTILGAAVVDDILAVIVLSIMMSFAGQGQIDLVSLTKQLLIQVLYFIGLVIVVKWITPIIFRVTTMLQVQYATVITALIIAFSLAYLAEVVGLSDVVGAFFAGVAVGQTEYRHKINLAIEGIGNSIFMPLFFVNIGLSMTFTNFLGQLGFIISLVIVAVLTKIIGCGGAVKLLGFDWTSSFIVGTGMVSRGEMALIVAQIGLTSHLMSATHYSAVIMAIIITTLLSPLLLKKAISQK
ncbi:napA3 protein [Lapidilactobacillus dextrinicus DSM 20335]|uniref:NapA3 protein n=1 Tax=Lapidilactobacillus dextrinicus DSM 20335 TaxID=1423738 RepID=A0A0R2BHW1_9LACO|nr:cation:proton antiporter [Lapidilactobacillus dextrinicus]KRM78897.1 napA3 protein [Lapidilactobacillus dextrinicus DSM 20335]QFG47530.1 cation:proton antiporter [Lapidilactobacillus dextrinicus]